MFFFLSLTHPSLIAPQDPAPPHLQCMTVSFTARCSHPALHTALFTPSWALLQRVVSVFHERLTNSQGAAGETNYQWRWLRTENRDTHRVYSQNYPLIQGGRFEIPKAYHFIAYHIFYSTSTQKIAYIDFRCDYAC